MQSDNPAEFPVVGVGASAGGLEALLHLFRDMETQPGVAFVVVLHLSPDFETMVDDLLARQTKLPIRLVDNETEVEPNTIYVMPPKVEMIISGGRLLLTEREVERGLWLPIDGFFRSLATDAGTRAVGVILSGTGSDGSRGLCAIHDSGGLTVAQDPRTAKFDGMPKSAIDTGIVDLILPPEEIRHALERYARRCAEGDDAAVEAPETSQGASLILDLLHRDSGVDFSHYKTSTIGRRLDRRLLLTGVPDIDTYAEKVRGDSEERDVLYQDLLIGVTSFFREEHAFDGLTRTAIPELVRRLPQDQELRVWSAGCATGEEAYSLAIAILEEFRKLDREPQLRLFATDVYPRSLERASAGVYPAEHALANIDEELLERYFTLDGDTVQVRSNVRSRVVFARHNLLRDAPFTRLDLICCRNVLIYFKPTAQKKLIALFHFALRTGGVMFLGPSETPGALGDEFEVIDRRWKIYRKRRDVRLPAELQLFNPYTGKSSLSRWSDESSPQGTVLDQARRTLLERYAPPSLLISGTHTLVHSFHGGNRFLRTPEGVPSLQLLDLVDGELKYALAGALKRAADERCAVQYEQVPAHTPEGAVKVRLSVTPVDSGEHYLVTFEPREAPPGEADIADLDTLARERIEGLELELRHAKENLQATIEEMETTNEELQVTNEELVASNEELHSANEELQSVNEELHSVNAEHQVKIQELRELTSDMEHLLVATEVHTLFLDNSLRLRKFTPKMGETFRIREADIGRRIDDFAHRLRHEQLTADLESVLATGERIEREVRDRDGAWYLLRILPYQPRSDTGGGIEGVVLTLIDISSIREVERELSEREAIIRGYLEYAPASLWAKDREGRYLLVGEAAAEHLSLAPEDMVGKTAFDVMPRPAALAFHERDMRVLAGGEPERSEEKSGLPGDDRIFQTIRFPLRNADGAIYAVGGVASDITDRKHSEEQAHRAVQRRDRFLAMLSHELRNPLSAIANGLHLLDEDIDEKRRRRTQSVIKHQVAHLSHLLDDLLDVTRIVQGRMRVRKTDVVLNEVISSAVHACMPRFDDRGVSLAVDMPEQGLIMRGDATRIEQVVAELLENAAKFTPMGGTVKISLVQNGGSAELRVCDSGVGLLPEERDKIFDLFYQRDDSIDRQESGLGVGLTLVRDLVKSHGGEISARSDGLECGTELVVSLPVDSISEEIEGSSVLRSGLGSSLRVVIVEDNEDSLELLQLFLEHLGHTIYAAENGLDGLAVIEEHRPDVALVDIGLPGMSGLELARAVRGSRDIKDVYLVALTGYGRVDDQKATAEAGFDEHLTKPVTREKLERVLYAAARHRAAD